MFQEKYIRHIAGKSRCPMCIVNTRFQKIAAAEWLGTDATGENLRRRGPSDASHYARLQRRSDYPKPPGAGQVIKAQQALKKRWYIRRSG